VKHLHFIRNKKENLIKVSLDKDDRKLFVKINKSGIYITLAQCVWKQNLNPRKTFKSRSDFFAHF